MKYVQLRHDFELPGVWGLSIRDLQDGRPPRLAAGIRYDGQTPIETTVRDRGEPCDFTVTAFNVPIATTELANAIEAVASSDVQLVPLAIEAHPRFFALNSIRVVSCVDESRSEFVKWTAGDQRADKTGQFKQVSKLVLNRSAIPSDAHFFRIEGWRVALVVSADVMTAMVRVGCVGAKFIELALATP
jgi:hypothetical protein